MSTEREQIIAIIEAEAAGYEADAPGGKSAPYVVNALRTIIRVIQAAPAYKPEQHGCPHPRCYARLHDLTVSTDHAKGPEAGK